jgi:hypothetical protein
VRTERNIKAKGMDSGVKDIFELEKEPTDSRGTPMLIKDAIIGGVKAIFHLCSLETML